VAVEDLPAHETAELDRRDSDGRMALALDQYVDVGVEGLTIPACVGVPNQAREVPTDHVIRGDHAGRGYAPYAVEWSAVLGLAVAVAVAVAGRSPLMVGCRADRTLGWIQTRLNDSGVLLAPLATQDL
jgi:hypothetical protein